MALTGATAVGLLSANAQAQAPTDSQVRLEPTRGLWLADTPVHVEPGERFTFVVHTASALTPPPGIQEPRAYRGFSVTLCSEGIPLGQGPGLLCFPVAIENLRPLESHSLAYRLSAYIPHWVARGRYGLRVRFPGGFEQRSEALLVAGGIRDCAVQVAPRTHPQSANTELHLRAENCAGEAEARVHFAPARTAARNVPVVRTTFGLSAYPLPTNAGGLGEGAVLLVKIPEGQEVVVSLHAEAPKTTAAIVRRPPSGRHLGSLRMQGVPEGAQVYWHLSPWESGLGPEAEVRLWGPRAPQVTAVVVHGDGATERLNEDVSQLAQRRALFGCGVARDPRGQRLGDSSPPWVVLSLLFWALSRKLGRRVLGQKSRGRLE